MTRDRLLRAIAELTEEPLGIVEQILDAALGEIRAALCRGEEIRLDGFGTFSMRPSDAKVAPHPFTGEPIHHPAYRQPVFKASHEWRRLLNNSQSKLDTREAA